MGLLRLPSLTNYHQQIVTNQLSPTNCHQPTVINQLSPTNCHQPTTTNKLSPTNCHQPIVINPLSPTNCHQPIVINQLPPTSCHQLYNCHQPIVINRLSSTNCYQPTATHQLSPTNCHPTKIGLPTNCHQPICVCAAVIAVLWRTPDVRPGIAGSPHFCRCDLRGRRGTWCSPRGRAYALGSLGRSFAGVICVAGAVYFAWGRLVAVLGALQGVGCTPLGPLGRCSFEALPA